MIILNIISAIGGIGLGDKLGTIIVLLIGEALAFVCVYKIINLHPQSKTNNHDSIVQQLVTIFRMLTIAFLIMAFLIINDCIIFGHSLIEFLPLLGILALLIISVMYTIKQLVRPHYEGNGSKDGEQ